MVDQLPQSNFCALVGRSSRLPKVEVYAWTIRDRLPTIPVPVKKDDPDVLLDLQAAFSAVYDRARYDLTLNYAAELQPPLPQEDAEWMRELLSAGRQP